MIVLLLVTALIALAYFTFRPAARTSGRKLPPGPPGLPVIGNILQLPALRPHPKILEWAHEYGEVIRVKLGPRDVIFLNSVEAADELLGKRSATYSNRAVPHVAHDILRDGLGITFMEYGQPWKVLRRALQTALGPGPAKQLRRFQELESRVLMYDLMCHGGQSAARAAGVQDPRDVITQGHWYALVRRYATSVTLYALYGKRVDRFVDNPDLHMIYDIIDNMVRVSLPGNYLADSFAFLRWLPDFLAPWRVDANRMHQRERYLWEGLVNDCKERLHSGEDRAGFVNTYLRARAAAGHAEAPGRGFAEGDWMQDKFLAFGAGSALEAGSDTSAMNIDSFILYMLNHPRVLKKAREEVDAVVGAERMPEFEDEERLPYLVACIKELLRHRPATPLGLPHSPVEDDFYKGYYIPKGCTIFGNIWAIGRDPARYYNPTAYLPERFYQPGKPTPWGVGPIAQDRDVYGFGWGRRFCQGSHVAQNTLFIVLARLVWGIDFSAPLDPDTGRPVVPDIADEEATWSEGFVSTPNPFKVRFAPRSAKHAELIREGFDAVQAEWRRMKLDLDQR